MGNYSHLPSWGPQEDPKCQDPKCDLCLDALKICADCTYNEEQCTCNISAFDRELIDCTECGGES